MAGVSGAAMLGCGEAVALSIKLAGTVCLWSGIMNIADKSGVTAALGRVFLPVTRRLFRGIPERGEAMNAITMNIAANLLGLGNAATPLGLAAMRALDRLNAGRSEASDQMVTFVVLNTASLQVIPATNAYLRLEAGSAAPMEILPCVWLASACCVAAGQLLAWLLRGKGGGQ